MYTAGGRRGRRSGSTGAERRHKLLIVDDHDDVRESLGDLLEAAGYQVVCVDGGQSALAYLVARQATEGPDVILLDFAMRDMTGADFLAEKATWPTLASIPIIFVTADGRAGAAAAAANCECLSKPIDLDDLLAALDRHTERH